MNLRTDFDGFSELSEFSHHVTKRLAIGERSSNAHASKVGGAARHVHALCLERRTLFLQPAVQRVN